MSHVISKMVAYNNGLTENGISESLNGVIDRNLVVFVDCIFWKHCFKQNFLNVLQKKDKDKIYPM